MKKGRILLLLFLFLYANSGLAISMHWCGGKLFSVDLFSNGEHTCKCGKKKMKPGCCKNQIIHLKACEVLVKTNNFTLKTVVPEINFAFEIPVEIHSLANDLFASADFYHPPPFKPKTPIYLLDKVFRI